MSANLSLQQTQCPADILLLIFEQVYRTPPASLRQLRLVSRQFNSLVNPIVYRHLKLNDALVKCFEVDGNPNDPREILNARRGIRIAICNFTRQITINEALHWASVVNLLSSLQNFRHLEWSFWGREGSLARNRLSRIPQDVLDGLAERWPSAQISLGKLSSRLDSHDDFSSLPPTRIVSLQMQGVLQRRSNQVGRTPWLKNALLKCDQLKVLHILDVHSGSRFTDEEIEQNETLPAVEELFLQGYFWLHSPSVATNFWNWSRLTSLRLEKVFIVNFLETVLPENLLQLSSFVTDGHCQSAVDHTKVSVLYLTCSQVPHFKDRRTSLENRNLILLPEYVLELED